MIALICFKNNTVLERADAKELLIEYDECEKGVGLDGNRLTVMGYSDVYRDELTKDADDNYTDSNGKKVSSWNIKKRPAEVKDWVHVPADKGQLVDLEEFVLKCTHPFYIERCIKASEPTVQNVQSLLHKIEEKTKQIDKTIDIMKSQTFNQKVSVHVGGGLITTYNELCLKEDVCTDNMQCELNNGWRIIAVCVQPDQRRPDYILGRFNPQLDVTGKDGAER